MSKYRDDRTSKEVIDIYLEEIGNIPLLNSKEERELAQTIRENRADQEAVDKLVCSNTRFVVSIAKLYRDSGLDLSDLIQAGNIGLIKAALRFDPCRGFRFITYAVWWITRSITELTNEQSRIVRLPINRAQVVARIKNVSSELTHALGREPTPGEIAAVLGNVPPDRIEEALTLLSPPASLDAPVKGTDRRNLIDSLESSCINPEEDTLTNLLKRQIHDNWNELTRNLTEKEKQVIDLRFHLGHIFNVEEPFTLERVGVRFGLTRERIRQIEKRAIEKLRISLLNNLPDEERAVLLKRIEQDKQMRRNKIEIKKKQSLNLPFNADSRLGKDELITIVMRGCPSKTFSQLTRQDRRQICQLAETIKQKLRRYAEVDRLPFAEYYGLNEQTPNSLRQIAQKLRRHVSYVSVTKDRIIRQLAGGEKKNFEILKSILEVYRYMRLRRKDVL